MFNNLSSEAKWLLRDYLLRAQKHLDNPPFGVSNQAVAKHLSETIDNLETLYYESSTDEALLKEFNDMIIQTMK